IIRLLSAFTPQTELSRFREVYLVMELMSHNLHEVISKLREFNCDDIPLKREVDSVRTEEEAPSSVEHCSKH
ncbi:hypothetical protein GCK32_019691, partial [Trichostrongylus colubriformis]